MKWICWNDAYAFDLEKVVRVEIANLGARGSKIYLNVVQDECIVLDTDRGGYTVKDFFADCEDLQLRN